MIVNANALHIPLSDQSVHCCITSPPYWGLRAYGTHPQVWANGHELCEAHDWYEHEPFHKGQVPQTITRDSSVGKAGNVTTNTCSRCGAWRGELGLEPTPELYVAHLVQVFREVWRVLRDDGVLFLNLGDSYASGQTGFGASGGSYESERKNWTDSSPRQKREIPNGLKPKDLVGIPWAVAKALQAPYYTGRIKVERDRVWLAAIIDAEGSICGFSHDRKDDGRTRTGVHVVITNSNRKILDEAHRIWPASLSEHEKARGGHLGKMDTWRWIAHNVDDKSLLMRELYPYLIAKKKQALLAWNLFEMSKDAKRLARSSEAQAIKDKRAVIVGLISRMNHLEEVDVPDWCNEPPPTYEPGWYLRSDIIWSKPNPMPESVTDRPTKAHEYIFLLSKQSRYYYDNEAIKEAKAYATVTDDRTNGNGHRRDRDYPGQASNGGTNLGGSDGGRNRRSVWTIATSPFSGAHFATFPPKLVEPMILAGTSEKGVCSVCGAPWERVVDRVQGSPDSWNGSKFDDGKNLEVHPNVGRREPNANEPRGKMGDLDASGIHHGQNGRRGVASSFSNDKALRTESLATIGWRPTCHHWCWAEIVPAIVLDPFAGSGTVGRVAIKHNRRAVMLELNPKYLPLQQERTNRVQRVMI